MGLEIKLKRVFALEWLAMNDDYSIIGYKNGLITFILVKIV